MNVWVPMMATELPTAVMIDPPTIAMFVEVAAAAGLGGGVMVVEPKATPPEPTVIV